MRAELRIRDNYYPITTELPVSLNFVLADIREPDKRNSSFTKTLVLNATNKINKLFENIFEVNVVTQTFNPNKKELAYYYIDGIEQFRGNLQLLKISLSPDGNIQYNCNIIGGSGSLFLDIADKELTDLDFSAYDHVYNRTNQRSSWANISTGTGYYYGFIDYGTNGGSKTSFGVKDFKPFFFLHEYLKKIIEGAGYTYTSSIIDSSLFKRIHIVDNNKGIPLSQSQLDARQFYVGLTSNVALTSSNTPSVIPFDKETSPFFDPSNIYNTSTKVATISENGKYNIAAKHKLRVWWTHSNASVVRASGNFKFGNRALIEKSTDSGASYNNVASYNNYLYVNTSEGLEFPSTDYFVKTGLSTGEITLNTNDLIKTLVSYRGTGTDILFPNFYDNSNNPVTTGTCTLHFELVADSETAFYCLATAKEISEGNTILVNNVLPQKIKQKDFFKSIINAFNLMIDVDKENPKHLYIETYSDFYTQGIINWENKTDLNKDQQVIPLAFIEGKTYIYKYKDDKDYYNSKYLDNWAESFGTHKKEIDNDFLKEIKTNEIIFSPTPNVANYELGIINPVIVQGDGINFKDVTPNIRLLYAGGVKTTLNQWNHTYQGTDLFSNEYGYSGHTDDPLNPTLDLNFGTPKELYYSFINAYFTNNNLYNKYHSPLIDNITNRDSKIVTKYLWLTPKDINEFSFRKLYFIDNAYYIVNKVIDFDPTQEKSTKCELIKLLTLEPFTPTSTLLNSVPVNTTTYERNFSNNSFAVGTNAIARGSGNLAIGENIFIPETSSNVTVVGSNNVTIAEGVNNVTVINTDGVEITKSNVNYINGVLTSAWNSLYSAFLKITASGGRGFTLNMDSTHSTIIGDCALNTIDCYLPDPATVYTTDLEGMGTSKIFTFKKIDNSSFGMTINPYGSETIDGEKFITINSQNTSITVQTDGVNWFII